MITRIFVNLIGITLLALGMFELIVAPWGIHGVSIVGYLECMGDIMAGLIALSVQAYWNRR